VSSLTRLPTPRAQRKEDEGTREPSGDESLSAPAAGEQPHRRPQPESTVAASDSPNLLYKVAAFFSYQRHRASRLKELQQQVDAHPDDAVKEAAFINELGKHEYVPPVTPYRVRFRSS
jgi:hypothetical protein